MLEGGGVMVYMPGRGLGKDTGDLADHYLKEMLHNLMDPYAEERAIFGASWRPGPPAPLWRQWQGKWMRFWERARMAWDVLMDRHDCDY